MSDVLDYTVGRRVQVTSRMAAYAELTKPRVSVLVLVATAAGFCLAESAGSLVLTTALLVHAVVGTALVAGGANALNQFCESDSDAKMKRTSGRPIPTGRLSRREALVYGLTLGIGGVVYLAILTNLLAATLAAVTFLSYVLVYTPLKRTTPWCVPIGAVPGALPPVIGWAAATGSIDLQAWLLFAIVFFWQLPHVSAIAWQFREDYAQAGLRMAPADSNRNEAQTDWYLLGQSLALALASALPVIWGTSGVLYAAVALPIGLACLAIAIRFTLAKSTKRARDYVLTSVVHLPVLLVVMLIDKTLGT